MWCSNLFICRLMALIIRAARIYFQFCFFFFILHARIMCLQTATENSEYKNQQTLDLTCCKILNTSVSSPSLCLFIGWTSTDVHSFYSRKYVFLWILFTFAQCHSIIVSRVFSVLICPSPCCYVVVSSYIKDL